jgi:hypothetical protein
MANRPGKPGLPQTRAGLLRHHLHYLGVEIYLGVDLAEAFNAKMHVN